MAQYGGLRARLRVRVARPLRFPLVFPVPHAVPPPAPCQSSLSAHPGSVRHHRVTSSSQEFTRCYR
ncbi:hypothetical protein GCM10017589_35190 [Streptomyces poonensis]|nr:hypothetical protein GCM10017589_35190 [Streptomyces poonensis]